MDLFTLGTGNLYRDVSIFGALGLNDTLKAADSRANGYTRPAGVGRRVMFHNHQALFLVEDLWRHKAFQMGELIRHVRYLHGLHELFLEVLLDGQFDVFDVA